MSKTKGGLPEKAKVHHIIIQICILLNYYRSLQAGQYIHQSCHATHTVLHIRNTYAEFTQASYTNTHNFTQHEISASINTVGLLSVLYIEPRTINCKNSFSLRLLLLSATFYYI